MRVFTNIGLGWHDNVMLSNGNRRNANSGDTPWTGHNLCRARSAPWSNPAFAARCNARHNITTARRAIDYDQIEILMEIGDNGGHCHPSNVRARPKAFKFSLPKSRAQAMSVRRRQMAIHIPLFGMVFIMSSVLKFQQVARSGRACNSTV
jgi:hypothetical protein